MATRLASSRCSPPGVAAPVPILRGLYTRRVPGRGDATTVRAFAFDDHFVATTISSMFADMDLAPGGETHASVSLGQSEHPLSPHFDDLLPAWQRSSPRILLPAQVTGQDGGRRLVLKP